MTLGKQFEQTTLPGMELPTDAPAVKQPHQMHPDEFASQGDAVFHSTTLGHKDVKNMELRQQSAEAGEGYSRHIHVGSEQAALERAGAIEKNGLVDRNGNHTSAPEQRLHTFLYSGDKVGGNSVVKDGADFTDHTGRVQNPDDHQKAAQGYWNQGEDKGSLSFSVQDHRRLTSQADFVRSAIRDGKEHEVHPVTMAMFKSGALDKGAYLPRGYAMKASSNNADLTETPPQKGSKKLSPTTAKLTPALERRDRTATSSKSRPIKARDFPSTWNQADVASPQIRVSDRGPNIETVRANVRGRK